MCEECEGCEEVCCWCFIDTQPATKKQQRPAPRQQPTWTTAAPLPPLVMGRKGDEEYQVL